MDGTRDAGPGATGLYKPIPGNCREGGNNCKALASSWTPLVGRTETDEQSAYAYSEPRAVPRCVVRAGRWASTLRSSTFRRVKYGRRLEAIELQNVRTVRQKMMSCDPPGFDALSYSAVTNIGDRRSIEE